MAESSLLQDLAFWGQAVSGLLSLPVALAAVVQLRFIYRQLMVAQAAQRGALKAEKERRTLEACRGFHIDPTVLYLKQKIYVARRDSTVGPAAAVKAIKRDVANYLNFLESICIGVEQGVYDGQIVFDNLSSHILAAVKYFIDPHPVFNPGGDLMSRADFHPLLRVYERFVALELSLRVQTTYRAEGSGAAVDSDSEI